MCKNIPSLIALSIHALTAVRLQPPRVKTQIAPNTAIIPEEDGTKKKKKHSKPLTNFFRYALNCFWEINHSEESADFICRCDSQDTPGNSTGCY